MGKDFENPFGLTTQRGNQNDVSSFDLAVFRNQGGPLMHIIAAKRCF
jgi:glycine hydroxymethyltransferase